MPVSVPPLPFLRRRPTPAPPVALLVVSAHVTSFDGADMHVVLTFNTTPDQPLAVDVGAADPAKWTARMDGVPYNGVGGEIELLTYNTVRLHLLGGPLPDVGPEVINYTNAPSDIGDERGRRLGAFSEMPLT